MRFVSPFKVLLFLLGLACSNSSWAQYPIYARYDDAGGLPSNEVYSIAQDQRGFLWIGCDAGLFKFDGVRYIPYKCATQRSKSITEIIVSPSGRIYCHNFQSQLFYLDQDTLHELEHSFTSIPNMAFGRDGLLYINHEAGVATWDEKLRQWQHYSKLGDSLMGFTKSIRPGADQQMYFVNHKGIGRIKKGILPELIEIKKFRALLPGTMSLERWQDETWIFAPGFIFREKQGQVTEQRSQQLLQALKSRKVTNVRALQDDKLWICTYQGLLRYDPKKDELEVLYPELSFSDCLLDREGNYWFSTLQAGLIRVPYMNHLVWNRDNGWLPNDKLTKITGDGTRVYFAAINGLLGSLEERSFRFQLYPSGMHADIQCLEYDPVNRALYYFTEGSLMARQGNKVQEVLKQIPPMKAVLRLGNEWVLATSFGVYLHNWKLLKRLSTVWSRQLLALPDQSSFYVATNSGLMVFERRDGSWQCADTLFKNTQILGIDHSPAFDSLVVLAFDGSIYLIKGPAEPTLLSRLPSGVQGYRIIYDRGTVWAATNQGLWQYHASKWIRREGLISANVQDVYISGNWIWMATGHGLQRIPLQPAAERPRGLVYLKTIQAGGRKYQAGEEILLEYGQSLVLQPEISLYANEGPLRYAYHLAGADTNWIFVPGNSERITIPNIPEGSFELFFKGVDGQGRETEQTLLLKGYVQPPFWRTGWFLAALGLLLLAGSYLVYRQRLKLLQKRQLQELDRIKLEHELAMARHTALKAQMNPHFIFNVLNSIKGYIYQNDRKQATAYLNDFSDLMRMVLEQSNQPEVSLAEELKMLDCYIRLEALLLQGDFSSNIEVDPGLDPYQVRLPAMLLQPYVENAFKHGLRSVDGKKNLWLKVQPLSRGIRIEIGDNGIGRKAAALLQQGHNSFATKALRDRMDLLNREGHIQVEAAITDLETSGGTVVTIDICYLA